MKLDPSHPLVTLDFEFEEMVLQRGNTYLPDCYPEPKNKQQHLARDLWPDQYERWAAGKSFGRPRSITWPQVLNVVYYSIYQLREGFDPNAEWKTEEQKGVFWQKMKIVDNQKYASILKRRLERYYEDGILPSGTWKFDIEEVAFPEESDEEWWVCGGYLPKRISDVENIARVPETLRLFLHWNLKNYVDDKRKQAGQA